MCAFEDGGPSPPACPVSPGLGTEAASETSVCPGITHASVARGEGSPGPGPGRRCPCSTKGLTWDGAVGVEQSGHRGYFLTGPAGRSSEWTDAGATGRGAGPSGGWAGATGWRFVSPRPSPPRTAAQAATRPSYRPGDRGSPRLSWGFCLTQWAGLCGEARGHPLLFLLRHTLPAALTLPRRREAGFQRNFLGAPHPPPPSQTDQPQRLGWD